MSLRKTDYINTLQQLKDKIRQARTRTAITVNAELLKLYWEVGNTILHQQATQGWGAKIIETLAADLKAEFADMKGFSVRNLKYMVAFAKAYPKIEQQSALEFQHTQNQGFPIVQGTPAQLEEKQSEPFEQAILAQLSWYHHCALLDKVKEPERRLFYIKQTIQNGWSRDVMVHQIESGLHKRQGNITSNFNVAIAPKDSELVQQIFKDPYKFEFIYLGNEAKERDLEDAMLNNVVKILLELGAGFALMGRQKRFEAGGRDFFVDLLFYHTKLRRHVIVELKIGEFEPEYVSKMNLYLSLADDQLRGEFDEPAIGIILCKTKNKTIAEYALRDSSKPIGIAEYKIAEQLPEDIKGELPSIEELESEIDKSYEELKSPQKTRLEELKQKLSRIGSKPIEQAFTMDAWITIFDNSLIPLFTHILIQLEPYGELYLHKDYFWSGDNNITQLEKVADTWKSEAFIRTNKIIYFRYNFRALKQSGTDAWDDMIELQVFLDTYSYNISLRMNQHEGVLKKLYTDMLTQDEMETITNQMCDMANQRIEQYISWKENNAANN